MTRWEEAHHTYRSHLETLSLMLHPFSISDTAPQTSAQVASQLKTAVEAIEAFAQRHQLPARHDAMTKVRKQVPALAALVDFTALQGQQADVRRTFPAQEALIIGYRAGLTKDGHWRLSRLKTSTALPMALTAIWANKPKRSRNAR